MAKKAFRPTIARTQNSMKVINSTKTNATIRDLDEEEGELEEKEGVVVSIKRDLINGAGWTVKDAEGNLYTCSCASSMYEVPDTVERGGVLYPKNEVSVVFTVNPVLRINTIKEIKNNGDEAEKIDIGQWTHGEEATTVIAKPKSAVSISDGFIELNYNNDNKLTTDPNAVTTTGKETQINTDKLSINSDEIEIQGISINDLLQDTIISNNHYETYPLDSLDDLDVILDSSNDMTQIDISGTISSSTVIGELKDPSTFPIRDQKQQLITDGNCVDIITIDTDGVIYIESSNCPEEQHISSIYSWISPKLESRNYIKVIVKDLCDYCDEGNKTSMEYINYCPTCNNWASLINTGMRIKCTSCSSQFCQNCGKNLSNPTQRLREYKDNYISAYGTTCEYCKTQLEPGTNKQYVNYCPDCQTWGFLHQTENFDNDEIINVLECTSCQSQYCCSCGISQTSHGLTLKNNPVQYTTYKNALRKLKYIRDGI